MKMPQPLLFSFSAAAIFAAASAFAAVPTPKDHLGYDAGADYKLADFADVHGYFQKLEKSSDRIKLREFGKSAGGRPMFVAFISSPENLKQLDRYREINRKLALGQASDAEAKTLVKEGKSIVWIDSGLHATEIACAQHAPELAYRMLTDESEEAQRIRKNVILMQVPVINPDGLDIVSHWYRKNVGTPYERSSPPELYQKYAGHDNNRDWFMMNLVETRNVSKILFHEWFPHIVYNQHQQPAFPARIFIPPYAEPLNPNIPPQVMEGINTIGAAMKERLAREGKTGYLSYHGFDAWWNGGLRSVPAFHNMHGILTETAGAVNWASPQSYALKDLPERFANGMPTKEPTVFYPKPWLGGKWTLRDAVDYMISCDFAILDLAAARPDYFLSRAWEIARANIEAGAKQKPYAYVVPADQWDPASAASMVERLRLGGIEVRRARAAFQVGEKKYDAGSFVLLAGQPFRGYLVDLLEPQRYPELRTGAGGRTKRPYDVSGWTLSMQMGVKVDRADDRFTAELELMSEVPASPKSLDHRDNSSFVMTSELLGEGKRLRWAKDGKILREGEDGFAGAAYELRKPRLALYQPWPENMDAGWTQHTLESFKVPHTVIRQADFQQANLRSRFDTIILAQQTAQSILHGVRFGEAGGRRGPEPAAQQRPEYTGGIGVQGLAHLEQFVREGGTLIALDNATELALEFFPLGVRGLLKARAGEGEGADDQDGYYCPGSLLRIKVDNTHPIAFGMPAEAFAMSTGGQAFNVALLPEHNTGDRAVKSVAKYADRNLLASGWISGERTVLGKDILLEAAMGKGRVVLFGFRAQFRGQAHGTLKLLLNAIYLGSADKL